ncbi:hypothetical protein BRC92_09145 [Halobacteriales archaeon QS_4_69_31]|jgi:hypothetical protein|nr:MAG: hypothetical protein BRC92_09145 [Halobacteriales archaeon QS_4_69_31]
MSGECHFCHGLVLAGEPEHIVLDGHGDHEVYMHERCARGGEAIVSDRRENVDVTCPECGAVETTRL